MAAARQVSGLYTAELVDADPQADQPWMATRFVEGPPLAQRVADGGPLPTADVRALAAGVAEALTSIHAAGLVHRDLKPSNVLLAADGPHVIDFGIAMADDDEVASGTGSRSLLGTLEYISPEQLAGAPVSSATDVFCLGGLLCFAATGRPPFGKGPSGPLVQRISGGRPTSPTSRTTICAA